MDLTVQLKSIIEVQRVIILTQILLIKILRTAMSVIWWLYVLYFFRSCDNLDSKISRPKKLDSSGKNELYFGEKLDISVSVFKDIYLHMLLK